MSQKLWQEILLPSGNEDSAWELFHENSKIGRYGSAPSDEEGLAWMSELHESLPFDEYPVVKLPRSLMFLKRSLDKAIVARVSVRELTPSPLTLKQAATIFHYGYGITRDNKGTAFPRSLRTVPSAGALYPLEIFFHATRVKGIKQGLYHYNPVRNQLRLLRQRNETSRISKALVQSKIALTASLVIFITAIFERMVFKYGDRGYRFVLLEAGRVAQNINLVSNALGFGCLNVGGFYDREIDDYLDLDGLTHSTIYMITIGKKKISQKPRRGESLEGLR